MLDAILYINLAHRTDRRASVEEEIARYLGLKEGLPITSNPYVSRIEAVPEGMVGCCLSHALAMRRIQKEGWEHTLVLEDDFLWSRPVEEAKKEIESFISRYAYSTAHIAYIRSSLQKGFSCTIPGVIRVEEAFCMMGYLVHATAAGTLEKLLLSGAENLRRTGEHWIYSADVVWHSLQKEGRAYAFAPRLGKSRADYSDLAGQEVDYG